MMHREARWLVLGSLLGLSAALVVSCGKKCSPQSCQGCCSAGGECLLGEAVSACGAAGGACAACGASEACASGRCLEAGALPDGGRTDGGGGGGDSGASDVDSGPPRCTRDDDCRSARNASVCDVRSGLCVPGRRCSGDSECQLDDLDDPCSRYGVQCRCDFFDASDAGGGVSQGTCRRRRGPCEACAADSECGADRALFGPPEGLGAGKCTALSADTLGAKYCLYQRVGACTCGTVDPGDGYCRPKGESCTQVGCNQDKDCPSGSICTVRNAPDAGSQCGGLCIPRCRWDFVKREAVPPGCRQGETCWVDSNSLDPASLYYGAGRCKPACAGDADCRASSANPFGGPNLTCAGELMPDGGTSAPRCRAAGECMDDEECPARPADQPYLGYCDRGTFACKSDCRTGDDPLRGGAFKDCRAPYLCGASVGGGNTCRLQTCTEQGGAAIACYRGQYCCGDDKDGDGRADPCPPADRRDAVGCYDAPKPPFCSACQDDSTCQALPIPAYLADSGACANGSRSPSCSPLKTKCVALSDSLRLCAPATWNDQRRVAGQPRSSLGCPAGYQVTPLRPVLVDSPDDYCSADSDCNLGTDAGRCAPDQSLRLADGGYSKACLCTAGAGQGQCPRDPARSLETECYAGTPGATSFCIESVVCLPAGSTATQPAGPPSYGCGLQ
jgi:hypothetical protein